MPRIGIINGGGDCAGLNAVIASIVKTGLPHGYEFIGFMKGFDGTLKPNQTVKLDYEAVRGITHQGGTILRTTNHGNRFPSKRADGQKLIMPPDILNEILETNKELGLDAWIVIGGDGTLSSAIPFIEAGVKVVGVPKTMDNDLKRTDKTFGFSTAVEVVTEALDRVHTTATSHDRVFFVETMGRNAGWVALYSGLAGGADAILIPEIKFSYEKIIELLRQRRETGRNYAVIVVAEGAAEIEEGQILKSANSEKENQLGGISEQIMRQIKERTGDEFEMRNVVLGHLQRGGAPNAEDRILSQRYGAAAMNLVMEGKFGRMVALQGNDVVDVDLMGIDDGVKMVTAEDPIIKSARDLGISFGD